MVQELWRERHAWPRMLQPVCPHRLGDFSRIRLPPLGLHAPLLRSSQGQPVWKPHQIVAVMRNEPGALFASELPSLGGFSGAVPIRDRTTTLDHLFTELRFLALGQV